MTATLVHKSLHTTLTGVKIDDTVQFRGIPYGQIPRRFAAPEKLGKYPKYLDCTTFGPRCLQVPVDVRHLLRIPPEYSMPEEPKDEFKCTNLDVVVPNFGHLSDSSELPVLVWIHGGSQAVTFGSAASGVCSMTKLVADSLHMGMPIIAVSVQYRLNVFALADEDGPPNLALRDQALALQWVQDHIAGFGGDPGLVTLAGESAGAIYSHSHLVMGAPVRQVILSSASLGMSPPQPRQAVSAVRDAVLKKLKGIDPALDLDSASGDQIVKAVEQCGLRFFFLEWEDRFEDWQTKTGNAEKLFLTDVQKEAAIWQAGVWAMDQGDIVKAFEAAGECSEELKKLYHIYPDRPSSCKTGALDFINDYKFSLRMHLLERLWMDENKPVYWCLVDEMNPWQPSSGAHHGVDLILLFGGFDLSFSPGAEHVGQAMREAWIKFINQNEPWPEAAATNYAFGPYGNCKALNNRELQSRRRMIQIKKLQKMDEVLLGRTLASLVAGKMSFLN